MAQTECAECGSVPTVERTAFCRDCYTAVMDRLHAQFWAPKQGKGNAAANRIGQERKARTKERLSQPKKRTAPESQQPEESPQRKIRPPRTDEQKIADCVAALQAAGGGPLSSQALAKLVGWPGLKAAKESGRIVMQPRYGYFLPQYANPNYVPTEYVERVKSALSDGPKRRKQIEAETDVSRWLLKKLEASGHLVKVPGRDGGYAWGDAA